MKWKQKIQQERKQEKEEEMKKPHTSSRFSISNLLPLSWFSKLKLNRSTKGQHAFGPNPRSSDMNTSSASAYLSFSSTADERPRIPDSPRRLSLKEEGSLRPHLKHAETGVRRRHHQSLGDMEFTTLGHLVPFSVRPGAPETDSTSTDSSATATRLRPRIERRAEDSRRPSFSGKVRPRQKAKVRVCSPRPSAVTKSAPTVTTAAKRRRRRTAVADEELRKLERFAVVKSSRDPRRDFRDSMMEMIWEKRIGRPEELESLLACYLALNSDEHHDVIIKVFRQLWFELRRPEIFPLTSKPKHQLDHPVR